MAWVAYEGQTVLGTAALQTADLPGVEHLTPRLSGVFVFPVHQRRGIGKALCRQVEAFAATIEKGTCMGIEADGMSKSVA